MYVDGDEVKLEPAADRVSLRPEHWKLSETHAGVVIHVPTGNCYEIEVADEILEGVKASILDLRARLYWVAEGQIIPSSQSQIEFGRAAIAVFMVHKRLWKPRIADGPERPEDCHRKRLARGLTCM